MKRNQESWSTIVMGWLFLIIAILLLTMIYPNQIIIKGNEIVSSDFFPKLCAYALILLSVWFLVDGYREKRCDGALPDEEAERGEPQCETAKAVSHTSKREVPPVVWTVGICLACIVAIHLFGLLLTCFVFLTVSFMKGGLRTWWKPALISAIVTAAMYVVFQALMRIVLPKGILVVELMGLLR